MSSKKHFFTRKGEKVYHSPQDRTSLGKKSVKAREKKIEIREKPIFKKPASIPDKSKNKHFPSISRFITDWSVKKVLFVTVVSAVALICIIEATVLFSQIQKLVVLTKQRQVLEEKLQLWDNISQKYPTYRDAYFQAALLAYQLGEREKEKQYVQKVLAIDPNFQPAQKLLTQ